MTRFSFANTKSSDIRYLIGVEIPDAFFLLEKNGHTRIYLDHRELGVFQEHNKNPDVTAVLLNPFMEEAKKISDEGPASGKLALTILRHEQADSEEICVPTFFPLHIADYLRAAGITLKPVHPFATKRLCKSPTEVEAIRESLRRTHSAYVCIENILLESIIHKDTLKYRGETLTSERLKKEVEAVLFAQNMFNTDGMIISCGAHAAIPHHRGHGPIRPHQSIVCDIFPVHMESGYYADMTRTYVKGEPAPALLALYDAVKKSQEAGIAAVRPGIKGKDVHEVCAQVFRDLGYDVGGERGFTHGTGHGLGLDIHEEPFLNAASESVLEPGHVVTVEPGLYDPAIGGVRIEDVVCVTQSGCENLTNYPKEFIIP